MTILRLHDGETLADAFERVTRERDEARQALRATDENAQRQLEALGLGHRGFDVSAHLADDLGEALLQAERERDEERATLANLNESITEAELALEACGRPEGERFSVGVKAICAENARLRALLAKCRPVLVAAANDPRHSQIPERDLLARLDAVLGESQ